MQGLLKGYVLRAGLIAGATGIVVLLLSLVPIVGICLAFFAWVVYVGAGVLAALWGRKEGALQTLQQGAIDGASAGAIAGVLALVVKWVADVCILFVFEGLSSSDAGSAITTILVAIIGHFFGVIVGIVVAAVLGGVGGLLYNAIQQQQRKPTL